MKNSSVLFCLIGLMLLMIGFNGFMAHTFSKSTEEINGIKLVKYQDIKQELQYCNKVCVTAGIHSDNIFEMPDNKQKVIKGQLYMCAIWPDGSQNVLIDWNKESKYLRLNEYGSTISPRTIECYTDTSEATASKLKVEYSYNTVNIEYYQYKFTLKGVYTKGKPQIILKRGYLEDGTQMAITFAKTETRQKNSSSIEASKVTPYDIALQNEKLLSHSKTKYIIIAIIGILMFFVPEKEAINTLSNIKNISNKILSK